jgi:carbon storage regulator
MLVLSRKAGQSLLLGSDIRVTLVSVRGNQCKIAIEAPREMPIDRAEIRDRQQNTGERLSTPCVVEYNLAMN